MKTSSRLQQPSLLPHSKISVRIQAVALGALAAIALVSAPLHGNDRVALVIGNNEYEHGLPLRNAVSDSRLIGETLKKCGFHVISVENADMAGFSAALDHFKNKAAAANLGLVFFAGHGVEVDGKNYLLPVDSALEESSQLRFQAISVETILRDMVDIQLPAKMLILDCCRNNPLKRDWMIRRSVGGGLAPLTDNDLPDVSLIMYSASPGQVSYDGEGSFSPFSLALAKSLSKPGNRVLDALYEAADYVLDATGHKQEPWVKADGSAQSFRRLVFIPEAGDNPSTASRPDSGDGLGTFAASVQTALAGRDTNGHAALDPLDLRQETPANPHADAEVAASLPMPIPDRGYFSTAEVFANGPYAEYNSYAKGQILRSAQRALPGAGSADGKMGRKTQAAILAFQESHAIASTGLLDVATLAALELTDIAEATYTATSATRSSAKRSNSGASSSNRSSSNRGGGNVGSRAAAAGAFAAGRQFGLW